MPDPGGEVVKAALAGDTLEQATRWRHVAAESVRAFLHPPPRSPGNDLTDISPVIAAVPGPVHAHLERLYAIE